MAKKKKEDLAVEEHEVEMPQGQEEVMEAQQCGVSQKTEMVTGDVVELPVEEAVGPQVADDEEDGFAPSSDPDSGDGTMTEAERAILSGAVEEIQGSGDVDGDVAAVELAAAPEGAEVEEPCPTEAQMEKRQPRRGRQAQAQAKAAESPEVKPQEKLDYNDVLTITRGDEIEDESAEADYIWHAIQHAFRTRHMLTGTISGTRTTDTGHTHVLVNFHGVNVTIPDSEMGIHLPENTRGRILDPQLRLNALVNRMLGAEIDFVVRGYDNQSHAVVASRKAAMDIKVRAFYRPASENALPLIFPGRLAQARVVAVSEKAVRLEIFGVERTIYARHLSWEWVTDARELYAVGDVPVVKVRQAKFDPDGEVYLDVSIREATQNDMMSRLEELTLQDRYSGTITDVHKGVYFIHLDCGLNAVAHDCRDFRRPSRKDIVSFVAVQKDYEQGVVLGMISRIIRHNI